MQRGRESGMEKIYQDKLSASVMNVIQFFNISARNFHVGIQVK